MDIDRRAHLNNEHQTRDQDELIPALGGQRFSKPWEEKQAPGDHFPQLSCENRLLWKMTLLNLDIKPSVEWLEKLEESEREHQNS